MSHLRVLTVHHCATSVVYAIILCLSVSVPPFITMLSIGSCKCKLCCTIAHDSGFLLPQMLVRFQWVVPYRSTKCRWCRWKLTVFSQYLTVSQKTAQDRNIRRHMWSIKWCHFQWLEWPITTQNHAIFLILHHLCSKWRSRLHIQYIGWPWQVLLTDDKSLIKGRGKPDLSFVNLEASVISL